VGDLACLRRAEITAAERQAIVAAGLLPNIPFPKRSKIDLEGTEHLVRVRGGQVEKFQKRDGWIAIVTDGGKLGLGEALPSEYLRRLELQNDLFGDSIRVQGLSRRNRFVISQPTLKGGEPKELEISQLLEGEGWRRVPIHLQDLPTILMGSAWWHPQEEIVLLDARKPNFKKTGFGVLPIDLVLTDMSDEMRELLA